MTALVLNEELFESRAALFVSYYTGYASLTITDAQSCKEIVRSSLPALIISADEGVFVSGLCHVARQVVKLAASACGNSHKQKQFKYLLGYKENCLKSCAEVSVWTRFCERDFPNGIRLLSEEFQKGGNLIQLPDCFYQLENEFDVKKKVPNPLKYFVGKRRLEYAGKDGVDTSDLNVSPLRLAEILESLKSKWCSDCPVKNEAHAPEFDPENLIVNNESLCRAAGAASGETDGIAWPYLVALQMTVADILVLAGLLDLVCEVACKQFVAALTKALPKTCAWMARCLLKPGMMEAAMKVWPQSAAASRSCRCRCGMGKPLLLERRSGHESLLHVSHTEPPSKVNNNLFALSKTVPRILQVLHERSIVASYSSWEQEPAAVNWDEMPSAVDPSEGELKPDRALRKRQQIENMLSCISEVTPPNATVVDFCSGGGHLGIVVAYLRPDCKVVLVENKEESIERARRRIQSLGLKNVSILLSNLDYLSLSFDVGITLHACGSATDLVLRSCIRNRAAFVICPCCYGGVQTRVSGLSYPSSRLFSSVLDTDDYLHLARGADLSYTDFESDEARQSKICMGLVDLDRTEHARAMGYLTSMRTMVPQTCSPKNNLLCGVYVENAPEPS